MAGAGHSLADIKRVLICIWTDWRKWARYLDGSELSLVGEGKEGSGVRLLPMPIVVTRLCRDRARPLYHAPHSNLWAT